MSNLANSGVAELLAARAPVYVFSVYPRELVTERTINGLTTYRIPAAKTQTDIAALEVRGGLSRGESAGELMDIPVWADQIAKDIVGEFGGAVMGQASGTGPGIWISTSQVPKAEDVAEARERQRAYFTFLAEDAHQNYQKGDVRNIGEDHRMAAKWLGMEQVPWIDKVLEQRALKECPHCYSKIDARSTVCAVCSRDIGNLPAVPEAISRKGR